MQHATHAAPASWTAILRDAVEDWRRANGWSRESAAHAIVEAHEAIGGPLASGIVFDPPTRDTFERMRVNADRIFRWLDDVTKDRNLVPANFIPSILAALPEERRMRAVNDMLRPVRLACRAMPGPREAADNALMLFKGLVNASAAANAAMADLVDGIEPGELERAQSAIQQAQRHNAAALALIEGKLARRSAEGGQ